MNKDLNLVKRGESEKVEFKKSLKLLNEIGETISAFSNSNSGIILAGVSDYGEIIGVTIGKNTIEELANYIKRNTDPQIYPSIKVEELKGKNTRPSDGASVSFGNDASFSSKMNAPFLLHKKEGIILIEVLENKEKPVFFKKHAYKRVGKTSLELGSAEIRRLAKESGEKIYWDEQVCEGAKLEDIDEEKVRWFLKKARYERNLEIEPDTPTKETLEKLEMIKYSKTSKKFLGHKKSHSDFLVNGKLTNAAILLFGGNPQKFFLQAETRCARFKGIKPLEFIDMKIFGGSIIDQREDAIEFIKEHIKLHAKIVGTEREETWEYPIEAVREAITNAVCHRDYETSSNVQIRIFDDRLEVWGCGSLPEPLSIEDLKKTHNSIPRNPLIAKCFFLIKFIEQWGTGTNRMIEWCLKHDLPEPIFEIASGCLLVTFRKYKISDSIMKELSEKEKKIITFIKEKDKISRKEGVELLSVSSTTLFRYFKSLEKKNLIKKVGKGKNIYYVLV